MLRGHLLSIYVNFLGKKRTSVYISREKGDHYYIQTRHNDFFGYYNLFLGKLKARINREGVYQIMLMSHGHPRICLKSHSFNMAAISVKRSI